MEVHVSIVKKGSTGNISGVELGDVILYMVTDKELDNLPPSLHGGYGSAYKDKIEKEFKKAKEQKCNVILFIKRLS